MTRSILASSVAACICLGLAAPLFAAEPAAISTANPPAAAEKTATANWKTHLSNNGTGGTNG